METDNVIKLGGTFLLLSESIKAFPTFSKPLSSIRSVQDGTPEAQDTRFGYMLAIGWSFFVAAAISNSTNTDNVFTLWAIVTGIMILFYEYSIRKV